MALRARRRAAIRLRAEHRLPRVRIHQAGDRQAVEILKSAHGLGGLLAKDAVHAAVQIPKVGQALLKTLDLLAARALDEFVGERRKGSKRQKQH